MPIGLFVAGQYKLAHQRLQAPINKSFGIIN